MKEFCVLIIKNVLKDLSVFTFEKCEILNIKSEKFLDFLEQTNSKGEKVYKELIEESEIDNEEYYAILYKDYSESSSKSPYDTYHFLKILFPSCLEIHTIITYHFNLDLKFKSSYRTNYSFYDKKDYLDFNPIKIEVINDFIKKYHKNIYENDLIERMSIKYMNAYEASHLHFSFLAFCIILESLIQGNFELVHKISRACGILCGKNLNNSKIIFENVKKIYSVRSKIIHGEKFSNEKIQEYLYYIECLCSKIIVELMIHNCKLEILNDKFTELGFGQQNLISSNWFEFNYNQYIEDKLIEVLKK